MDLSTITPADFKAQFFRDFPYFSAIAYDNVAVYNQGDEVFLAATNLFYSCLADGTTGIAPNTPSNTAWVKASDSIYNYVQDQDITNAFAEAQICFNQGLFSTDGNIKLGYLYMTAHFLCNDLKAAMAGINGTGAYPVSGRTVGSVSESYSIPAAFLESPILAAYTQSAYGMKYLTMVLPRMVGNVVAIAGGTNP